MKVILKQHYQDANVHLVPGQVYDGELVKYLLQHRMAEEVKEPEPVQEQVPEPEPVQEPEPAPVDPEETSAPVEEGQPKRRRR